MNVGSTFTGIGGFDLAAQRTGLAVRWQVENDPQCRAVLAERFDTPTHCDITRLPTGCLEAVDILCGGFPCQDLSIAGRRAGLAGNRSGLFFHFARLARDLRPEWIVLENVPGLLSSNKGEDMGVVVGTLVELGYGVAYRVLDAQFFGVPQQRRRVVIVGRAGGRWVGPATVLSVGESGGRDTAKGRKKGQAVAALTARGVGTCGADDNQAQAGHLIPTLAKCLTSHERWDYETETFLPVYNPYRTSLGKGNGYVEGFKPDAIHDALTAQTPPKGPPLVVDAVAFAKNQRAELCESNVALSLAVGGGKPGDGYPAVRQGLAVRRLTPVECERLQGFPDHWTDVPWKNKRMPDSARYKQLGNAVAVPVFKWVFQRIKETA